jgi:hypothetical protein
MCFLHRKNLLATILTPVLLLILLMPVDLYCGADDYKDNISVVMLDETIFKITTSDNAELHIHRKIRVFNTGGREHCLIGITESDFAGIDFFEGVIMKDNGDTIEVLEKDDGTRVCGFSGYALYHDVCSYLFNLSSGNYPFIVEYKYRLKLKSLFFWPAWIPQDDIPVDSSSYTLIVPSDFKFEYYSQGPLPDPKIEKDGGKTKYIWNQNNIPAFEEERCHIDSRRHLYKIVFVPQKFKLGKYGFDGDSWLNLGVGYNKMIKGCFDLSPRQMEVADSLAAGSASIVDLVRALHNLMAAKTRYVAIEIGIGGWKPSNSEETFSRGYGDCKDLAALYVSMLRYVGANANLALVRVKTEGVIHPDYPTLNRFNHVILYVIDAEDTLWVDPTCQQCEADNIPWQDENIYCLAIDRSGGHMVTTGRSTADDNRICRTAEVEIGLKKSVNVRLSFSFIGNPRHMIQTLYEAGERDRLVKVLKNSPYNLGDKFSVDTIIFPDDFKIRPSLDIQIRGSVQNASHSLGNNTYLDLNFLNTENICEEIDLSERQYPLYFPYPYSYCDTFILHIPAEYKITEVPADNITDGGEFGSVSVHSVIEDERVLISRSKKTIPYNIAPNRFAAYTEYLAKARECEKCFVVLEAAVQE